MSPRLREADLDSAADVAALVELVDTLARESGDPDGLPDEARARMAHGLREQGQALVLFALEGERPVGVAVCFWGFSTFAGAPLLNVHDLAVLPAHRRRGFGAALLAEIERRARARGCCKLTLEVHAANDPAIHLYRQAGFRSFSEPTYFVHKPL